MAAGGGVGAHPHHTSAPKDHTLHDFADKTLPPGDAADPANDGILGYYPHPGAIDGDRSGKATHKVDSAAMRQFSGQLKTIAQWVKTCQDSLKQHAMTDPSPDVKAIPGGNFKSATALRMNVAGDGSKINGSGAGTFAVLPATASFLDDSANTLHDLQAAIEKLADLFDQTESFNAKQTKQLTAVMGDLKTSITGSSSSA